MSFLGNLFGKGRGQSARREENVRRYNATCIVHILEPRKQDSMFPADVELDVLPTGLAVSLNQASLRRLDGMTKGALIGMYHWLNNENSTKPLVMPYDAMQKLSGDFYERDGNTTRYVESTDQRVDVVPRGRELMISIEYLNKSKGTRLEVGLRVVDGRRNADNNSAQELYNALLVAKAS